MIKAAQAFPEYQIVIAGAPNMGIEFYQPFINGSDVRILWGKTYDILTHSRAAIVSSGTAALETAIMNVPQVVVYQLTPKLAFCIPEKVFPENPFCHFGQHYFGPGSDRRADSGRLA